MDMIIKPMDADGDINLWHVSYGSRAFLVGPNSQGGWDTVDAEDDWQDVLNVSDDLSGSLEYIAGILRRAHAGA